MKFLFDDASFSFEALRTAGYSDYGGADLGEVLVTCQRIPEGDEDAWSARWAATAERIERIGRDALAAGHRVSAREALLRASNYYRTADFYLRVSSAPGAESVQWDAASRQTFADAVALLDTPVRAVRIPYEDTTLPGYVFLADDSGTPGPTVIIHGGYDSTLEEIYGAVAAGRCGAATTSSRSKAPARAESYATKACTSGRTGRPRSRRSSTSRSPCPSWTSADSC